MSLATCTTVERALAAYLADLTFADISIADLGGRYDGEPPETGQTLPPLHPLAIRNLTGAIDEDGAIPAEWAALPLPALVISAPTSQRSEIGYDICEVGITVITTPGELDGPARTDTRRGWLSAVFDESRLADIAAALSPPASGPDNRPVPELHVIGIECLGDDHAFNGQQTLVTLKLRVHATANPEL